MLGAEEPRAASAPQRRSLTLLEMLDWTYAQQRAHIYLRRPLDFGLHLFDQAGWVENPKDRRPVHVDAALVHGLILEPVQSCTEGAHCAEQTKHGCNRCARRAQLLMEAGLIGPPEHIFAEPRPEPLEPSGTGEQRSYWNGPSGRVYYTIRVAEVITEFKEEWRLDGRKRMKKIGTRKVRTEIEYCPIIWRPDPAFIEMCEHTVAEYETAVALLKQRLRGVRLRSHVITDLAEKVLIAASI